MTILIYILQALMIIVGAPLLGGIVGKAKARLQRRQGASIWRFFKQKTAYEIGQ